MQCQIGDEGPIGKVIAAEGRHPPKDRPSDDAVNVIASLVYSRLRKRWTGSGTSVVSG